VIGMMQYGVMFGFGLLMGVRYGSDPLALALLMMLFVLSITALTLMLTTFIHNEAQASGITLFVVLTLAPLGGAWWPLEIVPEWMRAIGHISPIAWVMDGFNSLMYFGGGLVSVLPSLAVLAAFTVAFFGVALLRFRQE
jgi:ABC-2 type transport system permease protein